MNDTELIEIRMTLKEFGEPDVDDKGLPSWCFVKNYSDNKLTVVKRNEMGHNPFFGMLISIEKINDANEMIGVTPEQSQAMQVGSMFGWHVPGADPNYEDGE
tara:strand:- start:113 stop:418 length:306 start_codon:yes stop_codon:yes gene_type:complete